MFGKILNLKCNAINPLESVSCRSHYKTKGKINASRIPDAGISLNDIRVSQGWVFHYNDKKQKEVTNS